MGGNVSLSESYAEGNEYARIQNFQVSAAHYYFTCSNRRLVTYNKASLKLPALQKH